jgi:uncharacterized small protein (DUF1192 family)
MDWDEVRTPAARAASIGEPLDTLGIAELEARVAALDAEIVRVKAEIERKKQRAAAADALFKS